MACELDQTIFLHITVIKNSNSLVLLRTIMNDYERLWINMNLSVYYGQLNTITIQNKQFQVWGLWVWQCIIYCLFIFYHFILSPITKQTFDTQHFNNINGKFVNFLLVLNSCKLAKFSPTRDEQFTECVTDGVAPNSPSVMVQFTMDHKWGPKWWWNA